MCLTEIELLIIEFGETHRVLITDSLTWLTAKENQWGTVLNHREFILSLLERVSQGETGI